MSPIAALGWTWFKVGIFGFGGGPSFIPLVRAECVDQQHWLSDAEFLDALALGNALPGPIAIKLAAFIGQKVAGPAGVAVAVSAVCLPAIVLMLALAGLYHRFRDTPVVAGMMRGVRPAIVGLLAYTAWSLAPDGVKDWAGGGIALAAFGALALDLNPAIVIGLAAGAGAVFLRA